MDIVIGYQGKNHVKAEQLRRLITGLSGAGTYVLDTQNKLAASMVTANQVRIDTGDIVAAGGAYATVETPETLIIESGATGQKRIDLVVARYEKEASTSVESMELAVVKGTPVSYGDAADPEVQEGSIIAGDSPVEVPLWRIPIDGLAPGTPEQLFETIPSIDALRDSVSQRAPRLLWEGKLAQNSSVDVPGVSGYTLLGAGAATAVSDSQQGIVVPLVCFGTTARGSSGMGSGSDVRTAAVTLTVSGDKVTLKQCILSSVNASGTVSTATGRAVYSIWGLA